VTPGRKRQVRAGAALIGATLLVYGEDSEPPAIPGDGPRPDHPRPRQPAMMPQPEIGLFQLGHVTPRPAPRPHSLPHRADPASPPSVTASTSQPEPPPVEIAVVDAPAPAPLPMGEALPPPEPAAAPESSQNEATPVEAPPASDPVVPPPEPPVAADPAPPAPPAEPAAAAFASPSPAPELPPTPAADPPAPAEIIQLALAMPAPAFGHAPIGPPPAPPPATEPAAASAIAIPAASVPATPPTSASRFPEPAFGRTSPEPAQLALPHPAMPVGVTAAPTATPMVALTPPGPPPMAGFVPAAPFAADDELILQLETAHGELSDTITAYGTRAGVYLPLGELARQLDLALTVSDDGRYAAGWVLDEKTRVAVNLREGTLRIGDRESHLAPRDAAAFDGELYLRAERFADLMPLALAVDLRAQTVKVRTLQPFPFEQRAAREDARTRLANRASGGPDRRYPREPDPWSALSFPLGDVELRAMSDTGRGTRGEADLRLSGDLAFMTARVYAGTSTRDGLVAARVQLGRRDPDAHLLGPLRATEFQLGDVGTSALPLGLRGVAGRGALVTNQPLERLSVFDRIDLRGELPAGYEAELYRNNTLVGSTRLPVNGQYEFLQVPVEFGLNVFRLVLYGPQGQRREEVRRISVGDGRLAKGELIYNAGLAQKDVNLAGVRPPNFVPGLDYGAWRATAQFQYGLTTGFTAALGAAWFQAGGASHWLVSSGLRTGLGSLAARFDLGVEDGYGTAIATALGGRTRGVNWTAGHAEYLGRFTDEVRAFTGEALRRASRFDLAANLRLGPTRTLPLAARLERTEYADGRSEIDASLRASMLIARVLASNSLAFTRTTGPGQPGQSQLTGSFDLATLSGRKTQLRGALDYTLAPSPRLDAVQFEVDRIEPETLVKASLARTFASGETGFGLSSIRRFHSVSLAFDGTYAVPSGTYAAILRLGLGFGRNPLSHRLFTARPGLSDSGAVAVRAWADEDGNHAYTPGEPLLPEVAFDTGSARGKTGRDGIALIGNVGDGTRTSLHIDGETLPDIAMAPASEGVELVPRAGRIHVSQFAIEALSDIEGTARFGEGRSSGGKGVSGLALLLVDPAGKAVAHTRSERGGMFLFEQVRPGTYRIVIDPGQARRLAIVLDGAPSVSVGPKSSVIRLDVRAIAAP
jgi:hypothetical protein